MTKTVQLYILPPKQLWQNLQLHLTAISSPALELDVSQVLFTGIIKNEFFVIFNKLCILKKNIAVKSTFLLIGGLITGLNQRWTFLK
jgi:hypothetical protein